MKARRQTRTTREALHVAFRGSPFRYDEAVDQVTPSRLKSAMAAGRIDRVLRGVYVILDPDPDDFFERQRAAFRAQTLAAMKQRPESVASHESAAVLHNLPCPRPDGMWSRCRVSLTRSTANPRTVSGVRLFHRPMPDSAVGHTSWGTVTSPSRTAVDLAAKYPLPAALVTVDAVLADLAGSRRHDESINALALESVRATLWQQLLPLAGTRGCVRAGRAISLGSFFAESPAESFSRAIIVEAGLPVPEVGMLVIGDEGNRCYADLAWVGQRVIGEVDGALKYRSHDDLLAEKQREDSLRRAGWHVVRWSGRDIRRDPVGILRRISRALVRNTSG